MLSFSSLSKFARQQAVYLSVAAVIAAFFWANGQQANPATIVVYALCFGNMITPIMNGVRSRSCRLAFPKNWLTFLAVLIPLTPIVYVISSALVVWIAPPAPQSFGHLVRTGWKLPSVAIFVYSVIRYLYVDTKERLEQQKNELQHSVKLSAAQLEMQEQEMERAREIQQSLLPKEIPQICGFEVASAWQPARLVGGDYFDVLRLSDKRLAICIADVSGKGVSAALLMANVQATVRAFARDSESPARVCSQVNSVLCGNIATGKFVTFFYGVLDATQRSLEYCNAGHPPPVIVSSNSVRLLPADSAVLGVFPTWNFENARATLTPGDKLLLFTDGITEACGSDGEEFGEQNLAAVAKSNGAVTASALNRQLLAKVTEFCAGRFQDDATLLVVAAT